MKKVYESHEIAYQNLEKKGATSWNEMYSTEAGKEPDHVGIERQRVIEELLEKNWFPKSGKALEIGCGTGPLIRWINSKGFSSCSAIDISETAIKLAKAQSKGLDISYFKNDFCYSDIFEPESFDFIVDGHCFHCIVEDKDRKIFLEKAYKLLKKEGVFLLGTMCAPFNKKQLSEKQKFKNNILYVESKLELEGSKVFDGKMYMSQRKIEHWKTILSSLKKVGFEVKLFKYEQSTVFSSIYVGCHKK